MALITTEELKEYTGVYPEDDAVMPATYCEAASEIVINYLGYDPTENNYTRFYDGSGENVLYLGVMPINSILSISFDGELQNIDDFAFNGEEVFYKKSFNNFPAGKRNIEISFNAGFDEIPKLIIMTVLRIAALLQTEGENNIGITSKSWDGEGSRTFVNYANYDKYLIPISSYKVVR